MFPCDGYLKLARKLAVLTDEACFRSAVSRAYYASFHNSKKFAESKGTRFSRGPGIHREVLDYFINRSGVNFYSVGIKLGRLKKNRDNCDYDDSVKNVKKTAENAVIDAEEIFKLNATP